MKKLKLKIKRWFFNTFVKRYLATVDSTLLDLLTKETKIINMFSYGNDRASVEYRRIMKILSSEKYREFFYKTIKYGINQPVVVIKPYGNNVLDRIKEVISTTYLYLFDRKLYDNIQLFKKWRSGISSVEFQINNYMAVTTLDERADRAIVLGVIGEKDGVAQKRMRNIQSLRVEKILANNKS